MGNVCVPPNPRKLDFREKSQLVNRLLTCRKMRSRQGRNRVVQELSFGAAIPRDDVDTDDVMNIVNACLDYERGLQQLIEVVEFSEENSLQVLQLNEFLKTLFSSSQSITINVDLLSELYQLTNNLYVPENELQIMYRKSRPSDRPSPQFQSSDESKTLALMIEDLVQTWLQSTHTQNKFTHPLLTFVKLLSGYVPATIRDELIQWRKKTAAKENITLEEEPILNILVEQPAEAFFYLLVRFKPDAYDCTRPTNEPENFDVQAYFIREQSGKMEYLDGVLDDVIKQETYERDALSSLLTNLISRCDLWFLQHRQYTNMFTIELFLPFTLLSCDNDDKADIHQWMLKDKTGNVTAISRKYPLVVRLYNRTYEGEPGIWLNWQRNWTMCKGYKGCMDEAKRRLLKAQQYLEEQEDLHESLQEVLCLRMTFVPPHFDDTPQHIFNKMMSAGTSVALWPRAKNESLDEKAVEQTYDALLSGCDFSALPQTLWKGRKEKTLLAHHLTLFWDDPDRLPLDAPCYPYVAPQERK